MTCPTCGGALQAASAKCAVCDPWAVPASDTAPAATALPPPALFAAAPLPKWLIRLVKKNPPAQADLELALRRSVISWSVSGVYLIVVVIALLMFAARTGTPVALLGLLVLSLAQIVVSLRFRRRTWLPRAVAVVGSRPDIGYHWFAGIPQLVRRNQLFQSSRFTLIALLVGRIVVQSNWPNVAAPQLILLAAYFIVALCVFAAGIVLEVGAVAVLRTRLNQPTATPAPAVALDRSLGF
jgi:hypothetical protein